MDKRSRAVAHLSEQPHRTISRRSWTYLSVLPKYFREQILRQKYALNFHPNSEITVKVAESVEEIAEALHLITTDRRYQDFTKFFAIPTSIIFVAKIKGKIVATLSLIPDSAMGLPSDRDWQVSKFRQNGQLLGELVGICFSKELNEQRNGLLLLLYKMAIEYSHKVLQLDGVFLRADQNSLPFYTDILHFDFEMERLAKTAQNANCPLRLGFFSLHNQNLRRFEDAYRDKPLHQNMYYYLFHLKIENLQTPEKKRSIHAYLWQKNKALQTVIEQMDSVRNSFSDREKLILNNLDLENRIKLSKVDHTVRQTRISVIEKAWIFTSKDAPPIESKILDVSENGFQIRPLNSRMQFKPTDAFHIVLQLENSVISVKARVQWCRSQFRMGCQLVDSSNKEWHRYLGDIYTELV